MAGALGALWAAKVVDRVGRKKVVANAGLALGLLISTVSRTQQEAFLKSDASDPRLVKLQNKISNQGDVYSVSPAKVSTKVREARKR